MATNLVPFESTAALPAFLKADVTGNLAAFMGGGFDSLSIKGKVFHYVRNGEKTLLTVPGGEGNPAPSVEVVILDIGPRGKLSSRTFYAGKYVEGAMDAPDCASNDGVSPDADVPNAQAAKCAVCKNNVKGSGATPTNPQGKACSSNKRLAIATLDNLSAPMLLRVPGDSIVALGDHLTVLKNRGVPNSYGVVTKVGFDYSVPHPKLTFKPVSFVTAEQYGQAGEIAKQDLTQQIIGAVAAPVFESEDGPAPVVEAPKPVEKPKTVIQVEDEPAPKPAKKVEPKAKPAVVAAPVVEEPVQQVSNVDDGMSSALDDLDFDDI